MLIDRGIIQERGRSGGGGRGGGGGKHSIRVPRSQCRELFNLPITGFDIGTSTFPPLRPGTAIKK